MRSTGFLFSWIIIGVLAMGIVGCGESQKGENMAKRSDKLRFFVGSSDVSLEYSIFLCELDLQTERFGIVDSFAGAKGPSYLTFSPDRKFLYTIDDTWSDTGKHHMSVSSFRVGSGDDHLEYLNSQSSQGDGPCHIHCNHRGTHLFVANYSSGHTTAFPLHQDGRIAPASSVVRGEGTGPVGNRQEAPHAHQAMLDPENRFLLVPDLGADKVLIYAFDTVHGELTPNPHQPFLKLQPGSGPRHLVFHPGGNRVYVVNELNSTVTACSYDKQQGVLDILNTVSTVPDSHMGARYPAAIRIDREGRFVYASTRGENSCITVFSTEGDGRISRVQVVEEVSHWPRDFNLDPSGNYLMVAGERSDVIELYRIDRESGMLEKTEANLTLPSPGCILYIH